MPLRSVYVKTWVRLSARKIKVFLVCVGNVSECHVLERFHANASLQLQGAMILQRKRIEITIPTYILNEDTQPVIRAIGVSHTACKDEFRQNIRSHS